MEPAIWPELVTAGLVLVAVLFLGGLLLNVHKMLARLGSIRKQIVESQESGATAHLLEAVAQLQSMAVSLDRIALRCDAMDAKLTQFGERAPATADSTAAAEVLSGLKQSLDELRGPVGEIRDQFVRSGRDRLADEIKRTLFNMGYDQVTIRTDLATLAGGEGRAQVEVSRGGVKAKGTLLVRDWSVVETKISPTYEMFP